MTSLISDARARLTDAVRPLMSDGRVHDVEPKQVVTPCIWLGRPRLSTRVQGRASEFVVATFVVTIAVDGDDTKQKHDLDDLTAQAWDRLDAVQGASTTSAAPRSIDIGGPNTTGMDITVDVAIAARVLCPTAST